VKPLILIIALTGLSSCLYSRKKEVFITDKDFVENYREFSPDSSKVLINYSIDLGAFGYGQAGTAIVRLSDTTRNLRTYSLPNTLTRVKWIDNKHVKAEFDVLSSLRQGERVELKDTAVNDVLVKILPLDYIDKGDRLVIEHKEVAPNGKLELVAYRYTKDKENLKFIHISVIADTQSDYVLYGTWSKNNELVLYSNTQYSDLIQYFLVETRPAVKYRVVKDDKKYGNKYLWIEQHKQ
jgi:hypothetical protein